METRNPNNATLIIVALTILLIVAMVCGVVIWMAQRTFALNEKLLDARLAQPAETQEPQSPTPPPQATPAERPAEKPTPAPAPEPQPQPVQTPAPKPTPAATQKTAPKQPKQAAPRPAQKPAQKPAKRKAPAEAPEAKDKVGPDGLPLNRVTLPAGNDELEWQL